MRSKTVGDGDEITIRTGEPMHDIEHLSRSLPYAASERQIEPCSYQAIFGVALRRPASSFEATRSRPVVLAQDAEAPCTVLSPA